MNEVIILYDDETLLENYTFTSFKTRVESFLIIFDADDYLLDLIALLDLEIVSERYLSKILVNSSPLWYTVDTTTDKLIFENIISRHANHSYIYSSEILNDRFYIAEDVIKQSVYAFLYAVNVIKGRWKDAEEYIFSSVYGTKYKQWVKSPKYKKMGGLDTRY